MNKRGKSLTAVVIIIALLIGLSFFVFRAGPQIVGMAGKVVLDFSNDIELDSGSLSGDYTSEVIDAGRDATWNNISWQQELCYQCELPDNGQRDYGEFASLIDTFGNVLLYHMNEESGNITDYSGNNNEGDPSNNIGYGAEGKFGEAISFTNKKRINIGKDLDFSDAMTVLAWIKPSDCEADSCIVAGRWRENGEKRSWSLVVEDGGLRFDSSPDGNWYGGNKVRGGSVINGNWYLVVGVYDFVNNKAYLNGELVASVDRVSDGIFNPNIKTYVGYSQKWKNEERGFSGSIDEVAIFNRVLSDDEILNIYKRGVLDLSLSVEVCDDSLCDGESFLEISGDSPQNLDISGRYFRYKFDLLSSDADYSPVVSSVSVNYDLVSLPNNPPACSEIENISFDNGMNYLLNLGDYFSDEDNDSLIYDYVSENVSVEIIEGFANVTSENSLSGSVVFSASDGKNVTESNLVYVFVSLLEEEQEITGQTVSTPSIGGGTGYGGGSFVAVEEVNNTLEVNVSSLSELEIVEEELGREETENPVIITSNAVNENTPIQRFASFFKRASFTTTQAVKNAGAKLFDLTNPKQGNMIAILIIVLLVIAILTFSYFMKRVRRNEIINDIRKSVKK
ncbi:hypothetical protein COV15_02515 [Candidatus Woesearchaeota archaeon CG10_big_fil_rev_8_21_14_0_10_34_12]|nr:MAG: hypothetical protein COV15_02515 [Candidatus Woesearchaeota archaeon CG10_big_fil_rev_8_21_14_0_10_34_12]